MNELVRWDPFRAVAPFEDSFFAIPSLFGPLAVMNNGPRMDVAEKDGAYQLAIELPGGDSALYGRLAAEHALRLTASASNPRAAFIALPTAPCAPEPRRRRGP